MLIAALSVVFHGAFAVMAHPLKVEAFHNCQGHAEMAVAALTHESVHHSREHSEPSKPATHEHGDHHGKIKNANTCCSAVSAVVLPHTQASGTAKVAPTRLRLLLAVTGEGYAPPTPSKPPRPAYQA